MSIMHRIAVLMICLLLSACAAPRGAGFQAEVLGAADERAADGSLVDNFAVFAVARDTLPILRAWPSTSPNRYNWINRQAQPASLIIAPGDLLEISIWDAEDNSLLANAGQRVARLQQMQVAANGRIFIPFVGDLRVAGMAPDTARARIEETLIESVPSAQVQLSVIPGRANTANLVAGVNAPGVYPLPDRNYTLLSLLAEGRGVQTSLTNPQVRLMRGNAIYGTALSRLYDDPALDTTLVGGDRVIIEAEERYFLSLGATGSEALHIFPKEQVSALDALAIVGGVSDARADPQGILILREYADSAVSTDGSGPPQSRVVFTLDLTSADGLFSARRFMLQPNDLVYATESPVIAATSIAGLLRVAIGLSNSL